MQIYAFGSICRGEIDQASDTDLLACVETSETAPLDPNKFSIYEYEKIQKLWLLGNPFAWHLHLEAKLIYSSDGTDFIHDLAAPKKYSTLSTDLEKFSTLLETAIQAIRNSNNSRIFNLACAYLAIRNAATCYSLTTPKPEFSRYSALRVSQPLPINEHTYDLLLRARLLSSRGYGTLLTNEEASSAIAALPTASDWMSSLKGIHHEP